MSTMQPFMFYKDALEEKPRNYVSDEHSSSRFQPVSAIDAFEANQKCFSFDIWRRMNQYPFHAYQPQNTGFVDSSQYKLNHFSPVNMSSPLFKTVGALNGPNIAVTSAKQQPFGCGSTISTPVGGPVLGAFNPSKGSTVTSNAMNSRSEAPLLAAASVPTEVVESDGLTTKMTLSSNGNHVVSPCPYPSCSTSVMSFTVASSRSGDSTYDDTMGTKAVGSMVPTSWQEISKKSTSVLGLEIVAIDMPRAVPQAQKASLSQFLEKHKERMTNTIPYACSKKIPENSSRFRSCDVSSKISLADINLSRRGLMVCGTPKEQHGQWGVPKY